MPNLTNYSVGMGGVNIVKDPLQLADSELTQAQNAELIPDSTKGGDGSLAKRGGLASLTSALAGSILGIVSLPLQTTYTRTLYVAYGDLATGSRTWKKTTDGTTWTSTTAPLLFCNDDNYVTFGTGIGAVEYSRRRAVSYKSFIIYPGNSYVEGTDPPPIVAFDGGTAGFAYSNVPAGPNSSTGAVPCVISDMVQVNGVIYLSVIDPAYSGTFKGRVLKLDPRTGILSQVANPFGPGTGEQSGGAPVCMTWFNGQLWAGLHNTAAGTGTVVRCYPDVDTTWTADTAALDGYPQDLLSFQGNLYAGMQSGNGTAGIAKRTTSTGAWANVDSFGASADGVASGLVIFNDTLYYCRYDIGGTHKCVIRKSTDGSSWSNDLDIESTYTKTAGTNWFDPKDSMVYNGELFFTFRSSDKDNADGQVLKRTSGGVWSRVISDENVHGPLVIHVARS